VGDQAALSNAKVEELLSFKSGRVGFSKTSTQILANSNKSRERRPRKRNREEEVEKEETWSCGDQRSALLGSRGRSCFLPINGSS
jgi:hypothetical protein